MHSLWNSFKLTGRSLLRDRGIFIATVVCLALGIGTQTVALELLDALLFRPPAGVEDASGLHRLYLTSQQDGTPRTIASFPYPVITALQEGEVFDSLAGYFTSEVTVDSSSFRGKLPAVLISEEYFDVLGVMPYLGRDFDSDEAKPDGSASVLLMTHAAASRLFGTAAGALGSTVRIEDQPFQVIGVLPEGFQGVDLERVDFFLPISAARMLGFASDWHSKTNSWFINGLIRDTEPVERRGAAAERILGSVLGEELGIRYGAVQAVKRPDSPVGSALFVGLAAVAALVLLIACMVVASLFVLRHLRRRGELGVRMALGAGDSEIFGLVLRDAFVVASLSGILAIFVAMVEGRLVRGFVLPQTAVAPNPSLARVAVITLLLVVFVTVFCGILPALRLKRRDITGLLKAGNKLGGASRMEEFLLAFQIAFAVVAFVAIGWFLASVVEIRGLDLGLDPEEVAVVTISTQNEAPEVIGELARDAEERLKALPQVEEVARAVGIPLASSYGVAIQLPGQEVPELETGGPYLNGVSPTFFKTLGTQIVKGRGFREDDEKAGAEAVMVVNETAARLYFPGEEALGQCLGLGENPCVRVVGVAQDARRSGLREEPTFQLYVPSTQAPQWFGPAKNLFVRTADHHDRDQIIREAVGSVAGDRVVEVRRLATFLERDLRPFRIGTSLLALFAFLALLLVALAMYAALARVVAERVREIGVRMAFGAGRQSIIFLLTIRTLRFLIPGVILGLFLSLLVGRWAEPLLFEVSATDPRVLFAAVLLLLGVVLMAGIRPTLRACKISPSAALSTE